MSVRILVGEARNGAAMYDSQTNWMLGPLWTGVEAAEHVDAFLSWLRNSGAAVYAALIFGTQSPSKHIVGLGDGRDPRHWDDQGLDKIIKFWRGRYLDEDGYFKEDDEGYPIIRREEVDV